MDIQLAARPERQLIRRRGSVRHIVLTVRANRAAGEATQERPALTLGLVLDRSGSMHGDKLATAKRATLAALDRLETRDRVAVVVFDDHIDIVQPAAPVSATLRWQVRAALGQVAARGSTALHQGWLAGCHAIAPESPGTGLSRLLLLTDGLANIGETDPERIAAEAAGVYAQAGISTSTFGVGADYDERLLAPMAEAGGGHFHHLRDAADIARAFLGELGDLLAVAVGRVRLELEVDPGITADMVSEYHSDTSAAGRRSIVVGDLLSDEERQVVVRLSFPAQSGREAQTLRVRAVWMVDGVERQGDWRELRFSFADETTCDAEERDPDVMHWVGLHHADRARREASERSRDGDLAGARHSLHSVAQHIAAYAGEDTALHAALDDLQVFESEVAAAPMSPADAKEHYYQTKRRSRGERDHRPGPQEQR